MWNEYNKKMISPAKCTVACSTCTCFTTTDIAYNENGSIGERKRTSASCQIEGFTIWQADTVSVIQPAIGTNKPDSFMITRSVSKITMCVGCGRCIRAVPEFISITATVDKMQQSHCRNRG